MNIKNTIMLLLCTALTPLMAEIDTKESPIDLFNAKRLEKLYIQYAKSPTLKIISNDVDRDIILVSEHLKALKRQKMALRSPSDNSTQYYILAGFSGLTATIGTLTSAWLGMVIAIYMPHQDAQLAALYELFVIPATALAHLLTKKALFYPSLKREHAEANIKILNNEIIRDKIILNALHKSTKTP